MSAPSTTKRKWLLPIAVTVAVLLVAAGILFFAFQKQSEGLELETNATVGVLPGVDLDKRRAELQNELDSGMIAFSVNTDPVFETGKAAGNLKLENPGNNAKLLVAEVYADDTGELLYKSKAIQPGSYLENVKLDKILGPGKYPATVYLKAYSEEDQSYIGQAGAAITITVIG